MIRSSLIVGRFLGLLVSNDLTWEAAYGGHKASSSALIMAFSSEIKSCSQFPQG